MTKTTKASGGTAQDPHGMLNTPEKGTLLDIDYDLITKFADEYGAANDSPDDPVVSFGEAEAQLRRLIAAYGFDRLPLTLGEVEELVQYCHMLSTCAGDSYSDPVLKQVWSDKMIAKYEQSYAFFVPAIKLYKAGKLDELRKLHREQNTLTLIGKLHPVDERYHDYFNTGSAVPKKKLPA